MARTLSKTGITNGQVANAWHVTQSIDALTGVEAYDITISGSLEVQGNLSITGFPDVSASLAAAGGGGGTTPTLQQVTDQGASTTTPITASIINASGNILGSNLYAQGGNVFTANTGSLRNVSNGLLVGGGPQLQSVTIGRVNIPVSIPGPITASAIGNQSGGTIKVGGPNNFINIEDGGDCQINFRGGESSLEYADLFLRDDNEAATGLFGGTHNAGNVRIQLGDPEFESSGDQLDIQLSNQSANFSGLSVTSSLDIEAARTIQGESGSFKRIVGKDITGIIVDPGSGQTQLIGDVDINGVFGLNATGVATTFGGSIYQFTNTNTIFNNAVNLGGTVTMDESPTMKDSHQSLMLTQSLSSTGDVRGDIIKIGNTTTTPGLIYYLSASAGQPEWYLGNVGGTDIQTSGSINNMIGVALGTNSTSNGMLLKGIANHGLSTGGFEIGQKLYMNSGGRVGTAASPATSRIIGYWTGGTTFYFDPEKANL